MFDHFYDSHIHSRNSHDATDTVKAICEAAIGRGLKGIAFTDHCDIDTGRSPCGTVKRKLLEDVRSAREEFGDRLVISMGLELGEAHHNIGLAQELCDDPEIDFIIGSLHKLRDEDDFYCIDYDKADLDSLMPKYYAELLELAECGCFDVLGHVNYQLRYMRDEVARTFDISPYLDRLSHIFRVLAGRGKGIEINTSGLRKSLGDTLPSMDVVKMFREAGGEIVTIGSDSHDAGSVGKGIWTVMERLPSVGFDTFAFFRERKPVFYDIS